MKPLAIKCHNNTQRNAVLSLFKGLGFFLRSNSIIAEAKYYSTMKAITLRNDLTLGKKYEIMGSSKRSDKDMLDINDHIKFVFLTHSLTQLNAAINFFKALGYKVPNWSALRSGINVSSVSLSEKMEIISTSKPNGITIDLNNVIEFTKEEEMPLSNMAFYCTSEEELKRFMVWIKENHPETLENNTSPVIRGEYFIEYPYIRTNRFGLIGGYSKGSLKNRLIIPIAYMENLPELSKIKVGSYEVDKWEDGVKIGCHEITLDKIQEVLGLIGMKAVEKDV